MIKTISPTILDQYLSNNTALLIDVRTPEEHAQDSIPGSILIPLDQLSCSKLPSRDKIIVTHCRFGNRSEKARQKLLKEDPTLTVYSLEGGITAWKER
jgi:rhodanese-related sulfurtransferase